MYDVAESVGLEGLLNQFPVPMFAVERTKDEPTFRYICLNRELEEIGQRRAAEVVGKTPFDLMPRAEATRAHDRYVQCARTRSLLRFREAFTAAGSPLVWDTTLQCADTQDTGVERLLGTAVAVPKEASHKDPALEDIGYFSTMADMQIENLISLFDTYRGVDLFTAENEQRIMKLALLCRTVQSAVNDIRRAVGNARLQAEEHLTEQEETRNRACSQTPLGSDTLKALLGNAAPDLGPKR